MSVTEYQVTVVGGGPAGLAAALYATRLGHDTAVIDRGGGRAAMMADTHNVIGVTEGVSGVEFLETALEQVKSYGADHHRDFVSDTEPTDDGRFCLEAGDLTVVTDRVVLATGFTDGRPDPPAPRTARGLHYCLHCDAYMLVDAPVYVMGNGSSAAHVAMIMLNFTDDVDLLLNGDEPEWSEVTDRQLRAHPVDIVHEEVTGVENDGGTVAVDDHGATSVDGVYAVGDATPGHNQIPTAMGEGARAGINIHYGLREFPKSLEELEAEGGIGPADVPGMAERIRRSARDHEGNVATGVGTEAEAKAETEMADD